MRSFNVRDFGSRFNFVALTAAALCAASFPLSAASFSSSVFATGTPVSSTAPDSVTYENGSVWIEYGNGASSTDYSGTSTIVQYSSTGSVLNTYSMKGSVDGLKYNPNTGLIWALQNQDAISQLSIINPTTKAVSSFTYGAPYPAASGTRGFDDVAFIGNSAYLSYTNPASTSDAIVVKLNNSMPSSPITFSTILTGAGLTTTDPDSLKSTPTGGLVLTSGNDGTLTFINNPGTSSQTAHSLALSLATGTVSPDDSIYVTSTAGTFYMTDTKTNTVYEVKATGLTPGSLFANVGSAFGMVDPITGVVTPIVSGVGLHGLAFVATPEPSALGAIPLALGLGMLLYRRRSAR